MSLTIKLPTSSGNLGPKSSGKHGNGQTSHFYSSGQSPRVCSSLVVYLGNHRSKWLTRRYPSGHLLRCRLNGGVSPLKWECEGQRDKDTQVKRATLVPIHPFHQNRLFASPESRPRRTFLVLAEEYWLRGLVTKHQCSKCLRKFVFGRTSHGIISQGLSNVKWP